ncbi:MAG: hypothetical protein ACYC0V_12030, partial [Armatimonadota bacterium]
SDLDEENYLEEQDESWVIPVQCLPVDDFSNRMVVTNLRLANNDIVPGMLYNIFPENYEKTKVLICVSLVKDGEWFHLVRYFDAAYDRYGPVQLAEFLGLSIDEVFPISYDISSLAVGDERALKGSILAEPEKKLSYDERRAL